MSIDEQREKIRPILKANNINAGSFLATDFLNLYNEVFMLLEMVPDMPDMLEELEGWQPKSYAQHFNGSNFAGKEIAIEAYNICPDHIKLPFDLLVIRLDQLIKDTLDAAFISYEATDEANVVKNVNEGVDEMKRIWSALNAIIHSENKVEDQQSIDDLLNKF
jgi:hypothetical protein